MTQKPPYPPPPWNLKGQGLMVFTLNPNDELSPHLPDQFQIETVLPSHSPAGFYIAQYETPLQNEPTPWHEWGDVFAHTRFKHHKGYWIREMAVDNKAAYQGGIDQWQLNKTMTTINFNWEDRITSLILNDESIHLEWKPLLFPFPFQYTVNFLSQRKSQTCKYKVRLKGTFQLCRVNVQNYAHTFSTLRTGYYWGIQFKKAAISILTPEQINE